MTDYISRQAAIDAVMEIYNAVWEIDIPSPTIPEYIEHHEGCRSVMQRIKEIVYTIECMDSKEPTKGTGINCKDRHPDLPGVYIVTCHVFEGRTQTDKTISTYAYWRNNEWLAYGVIAWMPMPEPYKEEE